MMMSQGVAQAQAYVTGLGGFAALSGAAAVRSSPPVVSSYDAKVGVALNFETGYHINDWFSGQAGYIWNRNRIVSSMLAASSGTLVQQDAIRSQHAVGADVLLYFRPRSSQIRPYLSAGPAWVRALSENKPGLRVAVGADLMLKSGWGFRYSFSEMMTANSFGAALRPQATSKLMNFQNLFGIVKRF